MIGNETFNMKFNQYIKEDKMSRIIKIILIVATLCLSSISMFFPEARAGDNTGVSEKQEAKVMEKATFAAGCFWHIEEAFRKIHGVTDVSVGYTGGKKENPTYLDVCQDNTGHAEAVEVTYDPKIISYEQLLDVFWSIHDPTQLNRQGPDVGSQYRSVIFYHSKKQKETARDSKLKIEKSGKFKLKLATQIVPAEVFYRAEEYHQRYFEKRGVNTCEIPAN